jgi:hypothetical protein
VELEATESASGRLIRNRYAAVLGVGLRENGIELRLTKPNRPWTNDQVERINHTLKDGTIWHYHYETHQQLREHLGAFLNAYNFAKPLKTVSGLTPYEQICKTWADPPSRFRYDPAHLTSGPNTWSIWLYDSSTEIDRL